MNKARIDELVEWAANQFVGYIGDPERETIRAALLQCAREVREEDARICEEPEPECCDRPDRHPQTGEVVGCCGSPEPRPKDAAECAAAIRSRAAELEGT